MQISEKIQSRDYTLAVKCDYQLRNCRSAHVDFREEHYIITPDQVVHVYKKHYCDHDVGGFGEVHIEEGIPVENPDVSIMTDELYNPSWGHCYEESGNGLQFAGEIIATAPETGDKIWIPPLDAGEFSGTEKIEEEKAHRRSRPWNYKEPFQHWKEITKEEYDRRQVHML